MNYLRKLFKKQVDSNSGKQNLPASGAEDHNLSSVQQTFPKPYLTNMVTYGCREDSVYFVDEQHGIRTVLVDSTGTIQNFPGIIKEDFWTSQVSPNATKPGIRFRTSFEQRNDRWIMLWQIQPDGRYWADEDGFGIEDDLEVTLYTYVDQHGQFTGPFRIYQLGNQPYTLDRFENALERWYPKALEMLKAGNLEAPIYQQPEDILFPRLIHTPDIRFHNSDIYSLRDRQEALDYWNHEILSRKLLEATEILLKTDKPFEQIGGYNCRYAIRASMTLFWLVTGDIRFKAVLDKFFNGALEPTTERILQRVSG